uniref:Shugoshin C-terminal domain-containing protein n=1 Tax=Pelusios castaneus TaxID=367368 RepID=A0A8C8T015_9SAUR
MQGTSAMASQEAVETSFFSLSGVRERMKEKKNSALKTAKLNASLASKIKTKIINNSSTVKVSLKRNNKALALALSAEKANTQRLIFEKMLLQKEVEQCHFQNATLRQRLYFLNKTLKQLEAFLNDNLLTAIKMSRPSEYRSSSLPLSDGQKNSIVEGNWTDNITDAQLGVSPLVRMTAMPMRVPLYEVDDGERQQGGSSAAVQNPLQLQMSVPELRAKCTTSALSQEPSPSWLTEEPLASCEENGERLSGGGEPEPAFDSRVTFGESSSCIPQSSKSLPTSALGNSLSLPQCDEIARPCSDSLLQSQGYITERKKRITVFMTSTPSSSVDFNLDISSNRTSKWSIGGDSCACKTTVPVKSNSLNLLELPLERDSNPKRESSDKGHPCDLLQPEEAVCTAEVDHNFTRVAEFVTLDVKSQSNSQAKAAENVILKKVGAGKKRRGAIKSHLKSSSDAHQEEESPPDTKKVSKAKGLSGSKSEAHKPMWQTHRDALEEVLLQKNSSCAVGQNPQQQDKAKDDRRMHMLNLGQSNKVKKRDLLEQKINGESFPERLTSMGSQFQSPRSVSLSNKAPLSDCAPQSSPGLEKHISRIPVLWQDLQGANVKCTKQKANRKTVTISKADACSEENVQSSTKMPEVEVGRAECQAKKERKSKRKTSKENNCNPPRIEVETSGPCVDVQSVDKWNNKDSSSSTKPSTKTYALSFSDVTGSSVSVQPGLQGGEVMSSKCVPENKVNKIPKAQRTSAVQRNKKPSSSPTEKVLDKVHSNVTSLQEEVNSRQKIKRKTYVVNPPATHPKDRASVVSGDVANSAPKQDGLVEQNLLLLTVFKTEPDSYLESLVSDPIVTNSVVGRPGLTDLSPVAHSEAFPFSPCHMNLPRLELLTAADRRIPENPPAPPKSAAIFQESDTKQTSGGSYGRKKGKVSSKEPGQSAASPGSENKALQDLTNASFLSSIGSEESSARPTRRRRDPACYAEPKLNSKLRRGDPFTNTEFLHSPVYKTKRKKVTKEKETSKRVKQEEKCLHE